jgi:hypothetical protein
MAEQDSADGGLRALRRAADERARRIDALVGAIARAVMAEMVEAWGARHSEQWARWYQQSLEDFDPEVGRIEDTLMRAPETARIERAAWLDVADRLAEALSLPAP